MAEASHLEAKLPTRRAAIAAVAAAVRRVRIRFEPGRCFAHGAYRGPICPRCWAAAERRDGGPRW